MVFRNAGEGDAEADAERDAEGEADAEGDCDDETDLERDVDAEGDSDGLCDADGLRDIIYPKHTTYRSYAGQNSTLKSVQSPRENGAIPYKGI